MTVVIAVALAGFSILCGKAGKRGFSLAFGIAAILTFIYWLQTGPGESLLNWIDDPSVDVPDNIPVPGQ